MENISYVSWYAGRTSKPRPSGHAVGLQNIAHWALFEDRHRHGAWLCEILILSVHVTDKDVGLYTMQAFVEVRFVLYEGLWLLAAMEMLSGLWRPSLTLSLLMSYIYMELLVKPEILTSYIYGPTFGNAESRLFLSAAQCFNIESIQKDILCHSCV
jgi:hypothetical protein